MKCAIHQPQFLPWLGYLHKIQSVDKFVFLDNVQFKKNEFQNRNRVLVAGAARWLTVPVSFHFGATLRDVKIVETTPWRKKMLHTLELNYCRTPYFDSFRKGLAEVLEREWDNLAELNAASARWLMDCFDIQTETARSSQFIELSPFQNGRTAQPCAAEKAAGQAVPPYRETVAGNLIQDATQRLIDVCRRVGADTYLSGAGGRNYLAVVEFEKAGIKLEFQDFQHPVYPQHHSSEFKEERANFVPNLSAVDGLFNCGGGATGRKRLNIEME